MREMAWFLLIASLPISARAVPAPDAACATFAQIRGGYLAATAFSVDPERRAVISPPPCLRAGDFLWIRPFHLNPDEYLILQKCRSADCAKAEVVRAWNSNGYMGPYPVLSPNIPVEVGARYMLWMQRVPMPAGASFRLLERDAPPLVFEPIGSLLAHDYAQRALQAARSRGPTPIRQTQQDGSTLVATFEGGSVVRMQALRPE